MTDTAISPLRRRMIEDMTIRQFTPSTQYTYVRFVKEFSSFFGRSPDKAAFEDVRRYQLHLTSRGISPCTINASMTALRFFFRVTLQRFDVANHIALVPQPQKLPVVLSPEEVARLLEAARGPKSKAALAVAYGAGLRVSEITSLKVSDIDSKRMVIRVEQGKGRKDRYVMLSPHLLELLRTWWLVQRPRGYLFPGQDRISPLTERHLRRVCVEAARAAGITKRVSPHILRHSFATHLLERKVDIRVIQALLGHTKLDTTAIYTRVATKTIQEVTSPLEYLIPRPGGPANDARADEPTEQAAPRRQTKVRQTQTKPKNRAKPTKQTTARKQVRPRSKRKRRT
jgi:integrase/recombinase XerD